MEYHPENDPSEPNLSSEAGLTVGAAKAAGVNGYVDETLNAGFITKQTPMENREATPKPEINKEMPSHPITSKTEPAINIDLCGAEESTEPALSGEAGLTFDAAKHAGSGKGYADEKLNAGFLSKQAPLPQ